ncbi:MAG TPA: alcohol dehydrogenase catalytic domain-containing protein [Acidimicrobiales bacterium]|nr:alcohol dehydrogenase catalytic domain-containing protein [Acidimicrobiales bacterium]
MKALVTEPTQGLRLLDVPEPSSRDGEVVIRPLLVGVCGTDLELIDATIDPAYVTYPLVLGHEWVGELVGDVEGLGESGDHVVVEGIIPCGVCDACRVGDTNRCVTYDEIGFTRPGALAERVAVPAHLVHVLDGSVALDDAALVEPMAVVWRALTRLPLREGARVAIIGDGTIALLAAHMVRVFAPSEVVVIGRRADQADLARLAGADRFTTETPEGSFDLVIEAAGVAEATMTAIGLAARGATVTLLGLPPHGATVEVGPDDLVNNDLIIQGSFSYTRNAWRDVVARLNEGVLRPSFLITHRFTIDQFDDAFSALRGTRAPNGPRGKVVIDLR